MKSQTLRLILVPIDFSEESIKTPRLAKWSRKRTSDLRKRRRARHSANLSERSIMSLSPFCGRDVTYNMTIIDSLLIGVAAAAAIYTVYRLFLGWRNSAFPQDDSEKSGQLNEAAAHRWSSHGNRRALEAACKSKRLNPFKFQN
jgi:hypothetical protein